MTPSPHPASRRAAETVLFTRRLARQCAIRGSCVPDWAVCDAIANGTLTRSGRRGVHGGGLVRFTRNYPARVPGIPWAGTFRGTVVVLCELTRGGCLALRLLSPSRGGEKSGRVWDF